MAKSSGGLPELGNWENEGGLIPEDIPAIESRFVAPISGTYRYDGQEWTLLAADDKENVQ